MGVVNGVDHYVIDSFTYTFIHLGILEYSDVWNDIDYMLRKHYAENR